VRKPAGDAALNCTADKVSSIRQFAMTHCDYRHYIITRHSKHCSIGVQKPAWKIRDQPRAAAALQTRAQRGFFRARQNTHVI
jgi:hypothetical protein